MKKFNEIDIKQTESYSKAVEYIKNQPKDLETALKTASIAWRTRRILESRGLG